MRNGIPRLFFAVCVALAAIGCDLQVETVTLRELEGERIHYREPKVSAWYYMGTKDGYHYFAHHDLPHEVYYRVADEELKWHGVAAFTTRRAKWVQLPWGVHDPNRFAYTNFLRNIPKQ